jgi:hypothetical protein
MIFFLFFLNFDIPKVQANRIFYFLILFSYSGFIYNYSILLKNSNILIIN